MLLEHPFVVEGTLIGVPDDKWGDAAPAVVELKSGVEESTPSPNSWSPTAAVAYPTTSARAT